MKYFIGFLAAVLTTVIIFVIWHLLGFDIDNIEYFAGFVSCGICLAFIRISEEIKYP